MSVTFAVEKFADAYRDGALLTARHYEEISMHAAHGFDLKPMIDVYLRREQAGELMLMVGREAGRVVAYLAAFIAPGMHYADCLTATGDLFYVDPEFRNGRLGVRMFRAVEEELKRRGVKLWFAGEKLKFPVAPLFRAAGMEPVEQTWAKWL
ncbi:MAG: GNAT family N-acetyltransferase [Burkholderia sp.]